MSSYTPAYRNDVVSTSSVPVTIKGKVIPGLLSTFKDGSSKWIALSDSYLSSNFDYSTFTSTKDKKTGKWVWNGTTTNSIPNLASRNGLTVSDVNKELYVNPQLRNTLNGVRVQQLGGINDAKKLDPSLPSTGGTSSDPNANPDATSAQSLGEIQPGPTTPESLRKEITIGDYRKSYPTVNYPLNREKDQDYIKFTMLRYSPKSVDVSQAGKDTGSIFGNRGKREILGNVTLPIQPSISDSNNVQWGSEDMNAVQALAAMSSLAIIKEGAQGAQNAIEGIDNQVEPGQVKALAGYSLANKAVGNQGSGFLTRATGGIINPNTELLYQGPALRGFNFTFTLSAREESEAKAIKQIIRFFKQGMSTKRATTNLFLMSPNTFDIKYIYGKTGKPHPWINQIKECALQNFIVNYTPEQNYATYTDGAMVKYELSLTFSELDPIYEDDYDNADKEVGGGLDSSIGY